MIPSPNKINKPRLGLITGSIAGLLFLVGVPLRQMKTSLQVLSGLHGNTAQAVGFNLTGTIIGTILAFSVYFIVGCLAGYIYEKFL